MEFSIFEIFMLICFGVSWPVSIYKSYTTKCVEGKSVIFLYLLVLGYIFGILHKYYYKFDWIVYLYLLNGIMVSIDIFLWHRYSKK